MKKFFKVLLILLAIASAVYMVVAPFGVYDIFYGLAALAVFLGIRAMID